MVSPTTEAAACIRPFCACPPLLAAALGTVADDTNVLLLAAGCWRWGEMGGDVAEKPGGADEGSGGGPSPSSPWLSDSEAAELGR